MNSLRDYIKIKAYAEWNVKWNLNIHYMDSKDSEVFADN